MPFVNNKTNKNNNSPMRCWVSAVVSLPVSWGGGEKGEKKTQNTTKKPH